MDPNSPTLQQASDASTQATTEAGNLPNILQELKGNLNSIFSKDNPLMQQREGALSTYLSAGDQARASYLPTNSGQVFSPTQLQALVSSRQAAALAPLTGLNSIITNQGGGLNDILSNAKDLFTAKVAADTQNAQRLQDLYKLQTANHSVVEANGHKYLIDNGTGKIISDLGTATTAGSGLGIDLSSLFGGGNGATPTAPTEPKPTTKPGQNTTIYGPANPNAAANKSLAEVPSLAKQGNWWDPIFNFFNPPSTLNGSLANSGILSLAGGNNGTLNLNR